MIVPGSIKTESNRQKLCTTCEHRGQLLHNHKRWDCTNTATRLHLHDSALTKAKLGLLQWQITVVPVFCS